MNKYRIVKKTNYKRYSFSPNVYEEAYFVQVKYFLFYRNLKYWVVTDCDNFYYHKVQSLKTNNDFPQPLKDTTSKYPENAVYVTGSYIFFKSFEAAKYFCDILKKQEQYIVNHFGSSITKKREVFYMNDEKENKDNKQTTKLQVNIKREKIIDL